MDQGGATPTVWNEDLGKRECASDLKSLVTEATLLWSCPKRNTHSQHMRNAKPVATLMESGFNNIRWGDPDTSYELANNVPYRQPIGCLIFLMICTRPDIAFAVCCLAQFCEQPLNPHWVAFKRILRYTAGTYNQGITFGHRQYLKPIGYTDSDWGGCGETGKSTSGYVFMIAAVPYVDDRRSNPSWLVLLANLST